MSVEVRPALRDVEPTDSTNLRSCPLNSVAMLLPALPNQVDRRGPPFLSLLGFSTLIIRSARGARAIRPARNFLHKPTSAPITLLGEEPMNLSGFLILLRRAILVST